MSVMLGSNSEDRLLAMCVHLMSPEWEVCSSEAKPVIAVETKVSRLQFHHSCSLESSTD